MMKKIKISIIGAGRVGTVVGLCLAKLKFNVGFFDIEKKKLEYLKNGKISFFEPGISDLFNQVKNNINIFYTLEDAILNTDVSFICVNTDSKINNLLELCKEISKLLKLKKEYHLVIVKTTIPPLTTKKKIIPILEKYSEKTFPKDFGVIYNPEFLREGNAIEDFLHPDRIVIGVEDQKSKNIISEIYEPINSPKFYVDFTTAEMIKLVSNAFLALKISFSNEIGNICKKLGIDSHYIFEIVGLDKRIGSDYFKSGLGFGGGCLEKDIKYLINSFKLLRERQYILKDILTVNNKQIYKIIKLIKKYIKLIKKDIIIIGILGLSFKPNTDDIKNSRALKIIDKLLKQNKIKIIVYDPLAIENVKKIYGDKLIYANSGQELIDNSDIIVIATEWEEFEKLNYKGKIVIDGRYVKKAKKEAQKYEGLTW